MAYVCLYSVCMYACTYVRTYVCMYVCMYVPGTCTVYYSVSLAAPVTCTCHLHLSPAPVTCTCTCHLTCHLHLHLSPAAGTTGTSHVGRPSAFSWTMTVAMGPSWSEQAKATMESLPFHLCESPAIGAWCPHVLFQTCTTKTARGGGGYNVIIIMVFSVGVHKEEMGGH